MELLCAIKIRSSIKKSSDIQTALKTLGLNKTNSCVILRKNPSNLGLLKVAESVLAYGEINKDSLAVLLKKRAKLSNSKRFDWTGSDPDSAAQEIIEGKKSLKDLGIKRVFGLHPPLKGFGRMGKKAPFTVKGAFGYRGSNMDELLKRMV